MNAGHAEQRKRDEHCSIVEYILRAKTRGMVNSGT